VAEGDAVYDVSVSVPYLRLFFEGEEGAEEEDEEEEEEEEEPSIARADHEQSESFNPELCGLVCLSGNGNSKDSCEVMVD